MQTENYTAMSLIADASVMERDFIRLITMYNSCITWLVCKHFRFLIPEDVREDYRQEILKEAWRAFPKYEHRPDKDFGTWLIGVGKNAVLTYRRKERTIERSVVYMEMLPEEFETPDYFDSEEVKCLHQAIADLPAHYKKVMDLYLTLGQVRDVAAELNEPSAKIEHIYHRANCYIRKNSSRYFEDIIITQERLNVGKTKNLKTQNKAGALKVIQYSESGDVIRVWPSLQELYRNGIKFNFPKDKSQMKWSNGFVFSYHPRNSSEVTGFVQSRIKPHPNRRPIDQLTKDGVLIRQWESISAAAAEIGCKMSSISAAINKRHRAKFCYGYGWRYSSSV